MLEAYLSILDLDFFEIGEAFKGLQDEHVWIRPADGLLSIGEIAGHIAFWEAGKLAGNPSQWPPDPEKCLIKSPLIDPRFGYYTTNLPEPPTGDVLTLSAEQVGKELMRVHAETMAHLRSLKIDEDTQIPGLPAGHTYGETVKYQVFHVAYHTGQIYSARHLLGEATPDN